jgi:hypothetical protein
VCWKSVYYSLFAQAGLKQSSYDLYLLSSWDYRHELYA